MTFDWPAGAPPEPTPGETIFLPGRTTTIAVSEPRHDFCRTYWGSHGCDLDPADGHDVHVCGLEDPAGICSLAIGRAGEHGVVQFVDKKGTAGEPYGWDLFS